MRDFMPIFPKYQQKRKCSGTAKESWTSYCFFPLRHAVTAYCIVVSFLIPVLKRGLHKGTRSALNRSSKREPIEMSERNLAI